jgi:hypothetical protein
MATQKQIDANRLNAQKSTGPRTEEGKRASSQNALQSGLHADSQCVPGESPAEFAELQGHYHQRFSPSTPEARFQVDNLVRNEWLLRRFHRVEAQLWLYQTSLCNRASGVPLGEAFSQASTLFMRLHRRVTAAHKAYNEAMVQLQRLGLTPQQPAQPAPQPDPEPAPQPTETKSETPQLASFRPTPPQPPAPSPMLRKMIDSLRPELAIPRR